ncbi:MAG: P1 family peptidase, partial [Vicinamibacteraceae bacterium]
ARRRHGERAPRPRALVPTDALSPLFQAVLEATEEAVYNSLLAAPTMTGNGHTVEALPIDELRRLLQSASSRR